MLGQLREKSSSFESEQAGEKKRKSAVDRDEAGDSKSCPRVSRKKNSNGEVVMVQEINTVKDAEDEIGDKAKSRPDNLAEGSFC